MEVPICLRHSKSETVFMASGTALDSEELKLLFDKIRELNWNLADIQVDDFTLEVEDELEG